MKQIRQINKMPAILIATAVFVLGSGPAFAGAFDFQNKLELGVSAGYNTDYWRIGGSKLASRAGALGDNRETALSTETIAGGVQSYLASQLVGIDFMPLGKVDNVTVTDANVSDLTGSGSALSVNGINADAQVNYHIFPWLFIRSGANINIGLPVEYTLKGRFVGTVNARTVISGTPATFNVVEAVAIDVTEEATYRVSGSDIEIPILLGFNLVNAENFSSYAAIGVNITIGGYKEELSGKRTASSSSASDGFTELGQAFGPRPGDFDSVTNENNATLLGLHWLIGMKYQIMPNLFAFTELRWLRSAAIDTETVTSGADSVADSVIGGVLNNIATGADAASSPLGGISKGYSARWALGITYALSLGESSSSVPVDPEAQQSN